MHGFLRLNRLPAIFAKLPLEDELTDDTPHVPLFGRVVAKRGPFLVIRTPHGDAQSLVRPDSLSERDAAVLKLLDLADHVMVEGPAIRTKTGALAVSARRYEHLGKALLPFVKTTVHTGDAEIKASKSLPAGCSRARARNWSDASCGRRSRVS